MTSYIQRSCLLPLVAGGCLSALAFGQHAQEGRANGPSADLFARLPASTYAAVQFAGLDACRRATAASPVRPLVEQVLHDLPEELRTRLFEQGLDRAADELREGLEHAGLRPGDVRDLLARPMVLALGRLTLEGKGPSVALLVDEGPARGARERCWDALAERLLPRGTGGTAVPIEGADVQLLRLPDGPPMFVGTVGSAFVVTNSRGYLQELVAVAAGGASFADSPMLRRSRQRAPGESLLSLAVDTRWAAAMLQPILPYEAAAFADALGLGAVDGFVATSSFGTDGSCDLLHLGMAGSPAGLTKALFAGPLDLSFLRACPASTVMVGAAHFDVDAFAGAAERLLRLLPEEAQAEVRDGLRRELRQAGIGADGLRRALASFGPQVGMALSLASDGLPKPELLMHLTMRDAETVARLLQRLEKATAERGLEWRTRSVDGTAVRYCPLPLGDSPLQLTPCYAMVGDTLWLGSEVAVLVRTLRPAQDHEGLDQQDDVPALLAQATDANGVLHVRTSHLVGMLWPLLETWVTPQLDAQRDELGFGSEVLPDEELVQAALGSSTTLLRVDAHGFTVEQHGPTRFGHQMAAIGFVLDELLARAAAKIF